MRPQVTYLDLYSKQYIVLPVGLNGNCLEFFFMCIRHRPYKDPTRCFRDFHVEIIESDIGSCNNVLNFFLFCFSR